MDIEKRASEKHEASLAVEDVVCDEPVRNQRQTRNFDENADDMMEVTTSTAGGISGISREESGTIIFDNGESIICESPVCNELQTSFKNPLMQCSNKENSLQLKSKTNILPLAIDDVAEKGNPTMELRPPIGERNYVRRTLNFDAVSTATEDVVIPFAPSFNPGKTTKTTEMDSLQNIESCVQFGVSAAPEKIVLDTEYLRPNENVDEKPDDDMDIETPTEKKNCSLKFLDELPHVKFDIPDDDDPSEDSWVRSGLQSLRKTMMVEDGEAMDCMQTPNKRGLLRNNFQMTPHRSILEFEAIEEEIRKEEESSTSKKPLIKSKNRETIHFPKDMTLDVDADSFKSTLDTEKRERKNQRTSSNTPEPKNKRRLSKRDSLQNLIGNIESDSMDHSHLQSIETILNENSDDDDDNDDQHIDFSASADREINESNQNVEDDDELGAVGGVVASSSKAAHCATFNYTINKNMNEATNRESDSFVIPPIPSVTLDYSGLMRARKGPNLKIAGKIWEAMSIEPALLRDMDRAINGEVDEIDTEEFIKNNPTIQEVKKQTKEVNDRIEAIREDRKRERFIVRLQRRFTDEGFSKVWLYIMKLECMQILRIRHREVLTLWIHINFEIKGPNGKDAIITSIKFTESEYEKKNWSAFDYVVYYQLKSELFLDGFDLRLIEDPEELVMESIRYAHPITTSVLNLYKEMLFILFSNYCRLELDGTRVFITKISRTVVPADEEIQYSRVEKKLFAVHLMNMRTVSYRNITTPPISAFKETIKALPTGLEFLKSFFEDPEIHLKK